MAINTLAPFVINGRLRGLMEKTPPPPSQPPAAAAAASEPSPGSEKHPDGDGDPRSWPKFIVNVSAMEGKFYRFKTANHPHTNMAKVRGLPRTGAQDDWGPMFVVRPRAPRARVSQGCYAR